jgi:anaerobic dimethyl sulfoxide reductase subunit A
MINSKNQTVWNACMVNCSSRCALRVHVEDGRVVRIETDHTGDDTYGLHQIRACLRGRSIRKRLYAPERIKYPSKRVGTRGSGKFERISWDEALDTIAAKMKDIRDRYGNEAFYLNYGTGSLGAVLSKSWPASASPVARLMNCYGGYLNHYNTYSSAQITTALTYTYGKGWPAGNSLADIANSKLVVFFGNNHAETRMSGGGAIHDLMTAKKKSAVRTIIIDPRHTDTAMAAADQWIPIRPGTDAALAAALAHVLITENMVDEEFLKKYCVGYDENDLPDGIPSGSSYKSYILGTGPDQTPKTPYWAAQITGIPEDIIIRLGREIGMAKPAYISQCLGPQRHANGEQAARAICMLPILTGNVGIAGGNNGAGEGGYDFPFTLFPPGKNPVEAEISVFTWTDAISRGTEMTALKDGVRGVDQLKVPVKFLWNYAGNTLINQHSDINRTSEILADDSLCEMIVVIEQCMTASAKFADILLPSVTNLEENDFALSSKASSEMAYVIFNQKAVDPLGEARSPYDMCADIAKRLGCGEEFTQGRTRDQWLQHLLDESRKTIPDLPATLDDAWELGIFKRRNPGDPIIALKDFRDDPENHRLNTPSGKIEIFSKLLWDIGHTWELPENIRIPALPEFCDEPEGCTDPLMSTYPLQMITHHYKQRTHSTYGNVDWLKKVAPQRLWINPIDAERRKIRHDDPVLVYNGRGRVMLKAKVTPRIIPGVVSLPQGAWYKANKQGIDIGGCANTLTVLTPSPLAKGNPQHTNLVEVEKYD